MGSFQQAAQVLIKAFLTFQWHFSKPYPTESIDTDLQLNIDFLKNQKLTLQSCQMEPNNSN